MVTYFVVNTEKRNKFEKEYQMPSGYSFLPRFSIEAEAIEYVEKVHPQDERNHLVVEKCEGGETEIVYCGYWYEQG